LSPGNNRVDCKLDIKIRTELQSDIGAIRAVTEGAFGQRDEADLVDGLRAADDTAISLVAVHQNKIIGHIALSRLISPNRCLALAPVSVLTNHQKKGVGSALIIHSIDEARAGGFEIIFVLGNPEYYQRFGFSVAAATPFPCQYEGPHFMAMWLNKQRFEPKPLIYAAAFGVFD